MTDRQGVIIVAQLSAIHKILVALLMTQGKDMKVKHIDMLVEKATSASNEAMKAILDEAEIKSSGPIREDQGT